MPNYYQAKRYSLSTIRNFVTGQQDLIDTAPLVAHQISVDAFFKDGTNKPDGPVDLLYHFDGGEQQKPALGFQEVDTEQDEEQEYVLVYINSNVAETWKNQIG